MEKIKLFNKSFVFIVVSLMYFLFLTNNSSLDSYAYAGYVKYNHYLFTPHHLFSNAFIYLLIYPFKSLGIHINILLFSKIINSFFQIINLLIFYRILSFLKINEKEKLLYVLGLAFSFSLWRFATENETYIIPIAFSLLGSFYFLKNFEEKKVIYIFLSSLFGAISCLFHQIHFFWWFGILIGFYIYNKNAKTIFQYIIPALIVPISYVLVLILYEKQDISIYNMIHFVFHDFFQGSVDTNFGWKGIFFQLLNSFRTFFQLHPNIYILIQKNWIYILPIIITLYLSVRLIGIVLKRESLTKKNNKLSLFTTIHLYIFIANYLFAFYNYGNIEFMVMLPYLLALIIAVKYSIHPKLLSLLVGILFIWNFSFAIFPNHYYSYYNDEVLVDYIIANPKKTFLIKNATALNHYFYKTGIDSPKRIILYSKTNKEELKNIMDKEGELYTDIIDKPEIFNKEKMTSTTNLHQFFDHYYKDVILTYKALYGETTVYKISKVKP